MEPRSYNKSFNRAHSKDGRLAQLEERQLDMLEVGGSKPSPPTIINGLRHNRVRRFRVSGLGTTARGLHAARTTSKAHLGHVGQTEPASTRKQRPDATGIQSS